MPLADMENVLPKLLDPTSKWYGGNPNSPDKYSPKEHKEMCIETFNECGKLHMNEAGKIGREDDTERLVYMNFKSHFIFSEESRQKFEQVTDNTKPDVICISEALVPIELAEQQGILLFISNIVTTTIQQPYKADREFADLKLSDYANDHAKQPDAPDLFSCDEDDTKYVKRQNIDWFDIFKGYKYIMFRSPKFCPWGKNWGNVIIMKEQPDFVISGDLLEGHEAEISHEPTSEVACQQTEGAFQNAYREDIITPGEEELKYIQEKPDFRGKHIGYESRCYVGAVYNEHLILSTHLNDIPSDDSVRDRQAQMLGDIANGLAQGKAFTVVGDLNAINPDSYDPDEREILDKYNRGEPCPTDAVDSLNEKFQTKPLNTGQKFECKFNKCVTHGYSNFYTEHLDMITDATDFDHQPQLFFRRSENC